MAILKRINKYQGLKDIDILVEETGLTSQYFQVYDFPNQIPQGKSSFLVAGSPFLADNVELKVEILDAGGNTVYTEAITNYLEGGARRVSIEVYDDVIPGDGFMYIVGELKTNYQQISGLENNKDEITDSQITDPKSFGNINPANLSEEFIDQLTAQNAQDVPAEFQGVYNVRYVRPIFINAALPNSQPIFFYQQPRVTVTEVVKPFIEQLAPSGSVVLSGSIEATPAPDLISLPAPIAPPPGFPKNPSAEGLGQIGQINEIFKSSKKSKSNPFRNSGFRSRGRLVRRSSPEQDRFSMKIHQLEESNETTQDKASSALIGATLTIKSPKVDLVKYPAEEFDVPTSFHTSIKKVLNEETIVPVDDFFITRKDTLERIPVPIIADEVAGGGQSEVTMSYTPFPEQSLSATHNRSFADVTVANLRTFSGDVYKTKIYGKSQGSLGDFELLHEGTIESPQTLIDPYSVDGFLNIGYFHTQSIVDNYWLLSGGTATRNDSKILDGIEISGSNYTRGSSVELTTSGSFALEKGVPYSITFNAHYFKEDKVQDNDDVEKDFELDVLVSEAALIGGTLSDTYQSVGKVDIGNNNLNEGSIPGIYTTFITPSDIGPTLKLKFKLNAGRAIINDVVVRPHAETNFNPDYFRVVLPMAYPLPKQPDLYDFLVEFYDVNNNIAETFTIGQNIEFTGAPLNIDGEDNLLSGSLYIGSTQGSGFEMAGVSSAFLRSIGYNGFDKTIAESKGGFLLWSGSIGDRLTASEDYAGVGLEIVDAHTSQDRYLKFRTNPSTFEVVTDQFFLGQAGSSFVSGSNGNIEIFSSGTTTLSGSNVDILTPNFYLGGDDNYISGSGGNIDIFNTGTTTLSGSAVLIETPTFFMGGPNAFVSGSGGNVEISSSNFHLTPEGSVTMSGDITANAGYIGDWKIVGGKISGSNITMDASNSTIYKTDQGPGSDSGESFAQLKNEYYLDFTPTTESPDNYYIKMGPNFGVDKDGILFASGAKFEGSITASQGLIGGFTTDSSSFHTDYIFISGSPALGGTDHRRFMFISSSNFNVKQDGDVTGSAVLFTGGKIAGFTIDSTKLKQGSSFHLDGASDATYFISSSNFQVTPSGDISGSQVLFTGGKIAGSGIEIDVNNFELDATDVAISSTHASMSLGHDADANGGIRLVGTNGGTIAMGDTLPANLTSDGIFMSGSGDFNFQGNSANFIRRVATALTIKAGTFDLDATTLILDSSGDSGTGVIRLGGSGGPNSPTSTTAGIYMDGGGALNVVGNSTNFLRTDAGSLTVNTDTLDLKTNTLRVSSSNGGVIAMGGTLPTKLEQSGIFLSGSGQFSFYSSSRGHIVFDGTDFKIASPNLTIDTSTFDINTAGGGNIALGTGSPSLSAAGIFLSGSGDFNFQKDGNNFIRQSGGSFQIKADTFDLDATTLIMDSAGDSGNGIIRLGASGGPTGPTNSTTGIYMDGGGALNVVGNSTNYFRVDGGSFTIKSDTFDLQTATISMSSADTGKIALGQTPPTRYDSGNGIFFDGDANFLIGSASGDKIQFADGDFVVQVGSLELDATNIEISSTNASMSLGEGNIILDGGNNKIKVGKTTNKLIEIVGSSTQGYIATGKDSATSTTAGFWLANNNTDPEFAVGDSTDFIRFNGGNLDINSQKLEIAASTLQLSTTEASMSLGHSAQSGSYGRVILEGAGVPTLRIGKQAHTITLTSGSGVYMDGDGNFRFGDEDGGIKFINGNFSITGSDVDIDVTDINITATGFKLSSTNASMSLGTNDQLFMHANSSSPFFSVGQSTKGYGQTGTFLGYINSVSRPRVSFVGSAGHFKFDTGVDIQTNTFELDANSGDLQISSAQKSMSLNDQTIVLDGANSKITIGSSNAVTIQGGNTDNFISMGSKTDFGDEGSGTAGILIGMDATNPQAEFVKSATEYIIFDNGVDMKTLNFELDANSGDLQISSAHKSMSLGGEVKLDGTNTKIEVGSGNKITIQGGATDNYITMGSKTSFLHEGSGTAGILIGMDGSNPQAEFVKNANDYFIFDNGLDIKTTKLELDAGSLQLSNTHNSMSLSPDGSNPIRMVGDGTDAFITMGSKSSFSNEGSGTAGIIIGMDAANPQAEFVKNSTNYFIFDDGIDIKTDTFKLDTLNLDIDSATSRIQVYNGSREVVRFGEISDSASDLYGLKIYDGAGTGSADTLVKLGGEGNEIAGWTITNDRLTGGNMIIRQDGTIESAGFASDVAGSGFRLTAAQGGFLEVENAKIRGTLATAVFEKESVNAVGGQLYVANSTVLTSSAFAVNAIHTAAQETMSVANVTGFSSGEILSLKKVSSTGFATEYVKVYSASRDDISSDVNFAGNLFVTRSFGQGVTGDSGSLGESPAVSQSYSGSQVIVSTGKLNTGYIRLNANPNDETTPYMDIVERTGSGIYDVDLKVRLGDLSGISSGLLFGNTSPGFGIFTENGFFSGGITATTGSITGQLFVNTSDSERLILGVDISGTNDGLHINDNNYWYTTGAWKVGGSNYNISNDASGNISINPKSLDIRVGSVDFELSSTHQSMSFADKDILIKKDGSDASITVGGTTSKQITIKGSSTQGYIASGKTSAASLTEGFWIANNDTDAEFHIGDGTSAIKFDDNQLHITSSKFELDVNEGDLQISSQHKSASYGNGAIVIDGSTAKIKVGNTTSKQLFISGSTSLGVIYSGKTSPNSLTEGFWLANNNTDAQFHIGDGSSAIKYANNELHITSSKFELNAGDGDLQISSKETSMSLADDMILLKATGNAGSIQVGQHSSNNIMITGSTTAGVIKSGKSSVNDLTSGFYIANDAGTEQFHLGDNTNALKYDGSNLHITASQVNLSGDGVTIDVNTFELDAANVEISSGQASMSVGYDDNIAGGINIKGGATSTIGFGSKAAPRMKLSSTSTDSFLSIGNIAFGSETTAGILLGSDDGNHEFRIYKDSDEYFTYDASSGFDLKTDSLEIVTAGLTISGRSGTAATNKISLGTITSDSDTSGQGVFMDGGGHFRVFGDANNFMIVDGGSLQIKSDNVDIQSTVFSLDANGGDLQLSSTQKSASFADGKIVIEGSSTNGSLKIGGVSSVTDTGGSNKGFYAEGDGDFIAKAGANEYVKFDNGKLGIKASDLSILTTGTNKIKMESSASTPTIALGTTLPTAYNSGDGFYVDGTGKLLLGNSGGNHVKYDGSTLTVAGTINIISGDLAGIDGDTISGSYPPASASQDLGFATQVVLDSAGMSLKNGDASKTLAIYGATSKIFDGENSNTYVEVGGKGITQVSGSVTGSLLTNGVMSLYGAGEAKAIFSSTGSLFRGDAQNTFTRVDSSGMTIVDNGVTQGTFTNGTINLYGNNGTDRKVTIDSDGMRAYYDSSNYTAVSASGFTIVGGGASKVSINSSRIQMGEDGEARTLITNTDMSMYSGQSTPYRRVHLDSTGRAAFGGAAGADVSTTSTDDVVRINPGGGVAIYEDSNNYASMSSAGMKLYQGGNNVAIFGSTVTLGNQSDSYMTMDSAALKMYDEGGVQGLELNSGVVTVGGADGATSDAVVIAAGGVKIYDTAADYIHIASDGLKVYEGSTQRAQIGSTITLAPDVSAPTTDAVVIAAGGVKIYDNQYDYLHMGPDGMDVYTNISSAAVKVAAFGAITKIGDQSNEHVSIDSKGLNVMDGTAMKATFGTNMHLNGGTVYVGATGSEHVKISSTGVELIDNTTTYGTFASITKIGDTSNEHVSIDTKGLNVMDGTTMKATFGTNMHLNSGDVFIGATGSEHVKISSTGVELKDSGTVYGTFAATTTIGTGDDKVVLAADGVKVYGGDAATYTWMKDASLDIINDGDNVASYGATARIGLDATNKTALRVGSSGEVTIGTSNKTNFHVSQSGEVIATSLETANTAMVPSITQGFINPGYGTGAYNSGVLYVQQVATNVGGTMVSPIRRFLDISGDASYIAPLFARGANFVRMGNGTLFDNKVLTDIRYKKYATGHEGDNYRVAQIMLEGAEGEPYITDANDYSADVWVKQATSLTAISGTWTNQGGILDNNAINRDPDDLWNPAFVTQTVGSDGSRAAFKLTSGNRIFLVGNGLDFKLVAANSFDVMRPNFAGGLNVGGTGGTYADYTYAGAYELYVDGDIGATGNVTAYADYVCDDCGWHSAAEKKICPSCGSKEVHYHDDVQLLKQIIDVSAAYPDDVEKQYQAYQKLAHLGVIDVHMPGSVGKDGLREKDLSITHNLHALNNYLISGLVQERKRSEGLEERIDKMETIVEAFGHEPYKGIPHKNDGILAENSTQGLGYHRKNQPFKGDYHKEKDLRTINLEKSKGLKIYNTSNEEGPMSKVKNIFKKKLHSWGMFKKEDKK